MFYTKAKFVFLFVCRLFGKYTHTEKHMDQWRIYCMAGMARAMGATLSEDQNLLGKN